MQVGLGGAGHVLAGESSADHRMVVMLDASTAELDVVEAGGVARHPDGVARLQLGVDHIAAEVGIDLEAGAGRELHVGLEADRHDRVVDEQPVGERTVAGDVLHGELELVVVEACARHVRVGYDRDAELLDATLGPLAQVLGQYLTQVARLRVDLNHLAAVLLGQVGEGARQLGAEEAAAHDRDRLALLGQRVEAIEVVDIAEESDLVLELVPRALEHLQVLGPAARRDQTLVEGDLPVVVQLGRLALRVDLHDASLRDHANAAVLLLVQILGIHVELVFQVVQAFFVE